jgi:hypothetical protein
MERYNMSSKETFRKQFRPELDVADILQWVDQDPAYQYKNVIMDYKGEGAKRVERYIDAGWELVESTETLKDDRSFTANSKESKLRPNYCISTTSDGHKQVLMRIHKEQYAKNQLNKKQARDDLSIQNSRRNGETITRKGNEVITRGSEVSFD